MKDRKPQVGILAIVLVVLVISGVGNAFAQTEGQAAQTIKTGEQAAPGPNLGSRPPLWSSPGSRSIRRTS